MKHHGELQTSPRRHHAVAACHHVTQNTTKVYIEIRNFVVNWQLRCIVTGVGVSSVAETPDGPEFDSSKVHRHAIALASVGFVGILLRD